MCECSFLISSNNGLQKLFFEDGSEEFWVGVDTQPKSDQLKKSIEDQKHEVFFILVNNFTNAEETET